MLPPFNERGETCRLAFIERRGGFDARLGTGPAGGDSQKRCDTSTRWRRRRDTSSGPDLRERGGQLMIKNDSHIA
jgi:hypothetical protein